MSKRTCILSVLSFLAAPLLAQAATPDSTKPTVDIQLFHPVAGATGFFTTESGDINSHFGINLGLNVNYANKPLAVRIIRTDGSKEDIGTIVGYRADTNLLMSVGLYDIGELGLSIPVVNQGGLEASKFADADPPVSVGTNKLNGFTQGNLRLIPKVQIYKLGDSLLSLAFVGTIVVPTAGGAEYASENGPVFSGALAASSRLGPMRTAVNLGYRKRDTTRVEGQNGQALLTIADEVFGSLAFAYNLRTLYEPVELIGEVFALTPRDNFFGLSSSQAGKSFQKSRTTVEGEVGMRLALREGLFLTAGAGGGLLPGYGAPAPRVFLGATYYTGTVGLTDTDHDGIPDVNDKCPDKKEDKDGFQDEDGCPDPDNDADGVLDEDDQCPNQKEDIDNFEDEDGCPDPDNDHDGLLDGADKCPNQAEDKDGFQDEDGCPDLDNDKDGIADKVDKCPNEPEDVDNFQDSDGCPDLDNDSDGLPDLNDLCPNNPEDKDGFQDEDGCPDDNDGDGIPDELDKCPDKPEDYNGIEDEDGCPDNLKVKPLVTVTKEKIEIKDKIFFKTGSSMILPKSFGLLDQVASVLKNYKHLTKVRIEGHTDNQGNAKQNLKLSQERAESVRTYLVEKGIDVNRLDAQGFGQDKPIASNKNAKGREMNRRVEFVIAEQKAIGTDVSEPAKPPAPPAGAEPTFDLGGSPAAPAAKSAAPAPAPAKPPAAAPAPSEPTFDLGVSPEPTPPKPAEPAKPPAPPAEDDKKAKKKKKKKDKENEGGGEVEFNF